MKPKLKGLLTTLLFVMVAVVLTFPLWRGLLPGPSGSAEPSPGSLLSEAATPYETGRHPSDADLEANFHAHEADFERLLKMSNEDAKVIRITDSTTWLEDNADWPRPASQLGFSPQRWEEYKRMFKELGLTEGIDRADDGYGTIHFISSTKKLGEGGSDKGYAYRTIPPSALVPSLDALKSTDDNLPVFKKLQGNWYLYFMSYE